MLTVAFQFNYPGAIGSGIGFEDATNGQARRDALELTAAQLGSVFNHTATIVLDVASEENPNSDTLASAGSNFVLSGANGFDGSEVVRTKILTGTDLNGAASDGAVTVNWGINWETSSNPADISNSEFDFQSTMYHELLHAMGWASTITESGQDLNDAAPMGQAGTWGFFDQFIADVNGVPVVNNTTFALDATSWNTNKIGGASPSAGLFFNGANATAANGGNPVGLYTPTTFENGSSITHLDDENPALSGLMMLAAAGPGPGARNLTTLQRAVLTDVGFSFSPGAMTVTQSGGSTSVSETGTTDSFDVVLTVQPLVDVVINVGSADTGEATVDKATLTFTPANWNTPQTVTVTGVDDADADGSQSTTITLSINDGLSDDGYDATIDSTVTVITTDDEAGGPVATQVGIHRSNLFYGDATGNGAWDGVAGGDTFATFGIAGDTPLVGDWDGNGRDNIGIHRNNLFYLDVNDNGRWDGAAGGDTLFAFGIQGDTPIVGDWDGNGTDEIGVHRGAYFYLDTNNNGVWNGTANGDSFAVFGLTTDTPIIGDWNGNGTDSVGIHRGNLFYLDTNGSGSWNGTAGGDGFAAFGISGDTPIVGDWNGNGTDTIGVHRGAFFYQDANGNGVWNGTANGDKFAAFGLTSDSPLVGKWNTADPLTASESADGSALAQDIDQTIVASVLESAVDLFVLKGISAEDEQRLRSVTIAVADLNGDRLAQASGATVVVDQNAAGHGWFVDDTPFDNEEFYEVDGVGLLAITGGEADGKMDLLSAVLHELGHVLGHEHGEGFMNGTLQRGFRSWS